MQQLKTQIVIAGAGPVGSVAAFYLASRGIDVVLLESGNDYVPISQREPLRWLGGAKP